ncbi:MAG: transporter [Burkholderiales bacterium PBB4]|nr:MAG: transporter [Burkholderiales bacterium PBB4]
MKIWSLVFVAVLGLSALDAQAGKRLGGGKSVGQQSTNVAQRDAAPVTPSAPAAANGVTQATPKPMPQAAPKKPWGAMLGGLAAGLGLAWLASSMGLGEGFGQVLMIGLALFAAFALFKWVTRGRNPSAQSSGAGPMAFQGVGGATLGGMQSYRPENVGNDASARPWERSSMAFEAPKQASASIIGSALTGSQSWGVPAGFDTEGFLKAAKANFVTLQSAWDRSDIAALRAMMTDGMLVEIQSQLAERETHTGGSVNMTDVVVVDAHLLGIEELQNEYMASVEFSGMIREDASVGPNPFREVWNMTKPKSGGNGWLVAGVQALQ